MIREELLHAKEEQQEKQQQLLSPIVFEKLQNCVDDLLNAIDGSTQLLERAKKLGRALAEKNPEMHSVSLPRVLWASMSVVKKAHPKKRILETFDFTENFEAFVQADDLLSEVFVNLFTNSVQYTESESVKIHVGVEEPSVSPEKYWKISLADQGIGIADELKSQISTRYLDGAKGSGLGLSIVNALVIRRYHGFVRFMDRVKGDHTQGLVVEILLPKAKQSLS